MGKKNGAGGGGDKSAGGGTAAVCARLAEPVTAELGLVLWDVRFLKEGASWYLRFFIDREGGKVSIQDCEQVSRRIDKLLDEADPIPQQYILEVCSPGLERELTRSAHFEQCAGLPVRVRLIRPMEDGTREIEGILRGIDGSAVVLELEQDGQEWEVRVEKKEMSSVRLIDLYDDDVQD